MPSALASPRLRRMASIPPALATPLVMAQTAATFLIAIGSVGIVVSAVQPSTPATGRWVLMVGSAVSVVLGISVALFGRRLGNAFHMAIIGTAAIALTILIIAAPNDTVALAMAALYPCIGCHAAFVFSWIRASAMVALALPCAVVALLTRDGLPWWAAILPVTSTALVGGAVAVLSRLASDASTDPVTGLPNRRGLDRLLAAADADVAIVLLELDLQDDRSDEVVRNVAKSWLGVAPSAGVVARSGSDEFALLLPRTTEHEAVIVAERLRSAVEPDCYAGVTSWRLDDTPSTFLRRADTGLYRAKASGRPRTVLESACGPAVVDELRQAIRDEHLRVFYQPIVDVFADATVVGFEALVRWESATQPGINAAEIIELAESHGLIRDLGAAVLRRACTDGPILEHAYGGRPLVLNVNVSGLEVAEPDFAAGVLEIANRAGWRPSRLVLELTESRTTSDTEAAIAQLELLRSNGIRIAIDDFGSGYSSLNRLVTLPADVLKLDRTLIDSGVAARPLISAIHALTKTFGIDLVVEGVETPEQDRLLRDLGVARAQDYLYGRPAPITRFTRTASL